MLNELEIKDKTTAHERKRRGCRESEAAGMEKWACGGRGLRNPETLGSAFSFPDDSGDCFVVFLVFQTLK